MAPLTRQTQKVFAGNANGDMLAVFGTMKTGTPQYSSNVETLQSATYSQGWSDAILDDKAPYLEEMNAVQYGLSYQLAYILQEGAFEYNAETEYSNTSIVKSVENGAFTIYLSLQNGNIGNPLTNTSYWRRLEFALVNNCMLLTGNQTAAGNKTFTGTVTLSGTSTAATQAYGTNNTRIATTAFTKSARNINWASGISVAFPQSGSRYTAPYDGVYVGFGFKNQGWTFLYINNNWTPITIRDSADGASYSNIFVPLKQGDVIYWDGPVNEADIRFYKYQA